MRRRGPGSQPRAMGGFNRPLRSRAGNCERSGTLKQARDAGRPSKAVIPLGVPFCTCL